MFQIFLNFAKYLFILLCTCVPLRSCTGEVTDTATISINQQIQENMVPLRDMLDKIIDPNTDRDTKLKILGKLEVKLEDGIKADFEVRELLKKEEKLEIQKEKAIAENKKYVIPLTIRQYATIIESKFPDIMKMNNVVPDDVWRSTPKYDQYLVTRKYRWFKILDEGLLRNNDYVVLLIKQLDANFKIDMKVKNAEINKTSSTYNDYRLQFCDSIVRAIDFGNTVVAHAVRGGVNVNFDSLIFDNVIDKYMKLFYNAMVGKLVPEPEVEPNKNVIT